jgi:Tfp pilus assembly protein PilX
MKHRRSERGVALIICLFALMLLSGIGLGMMYMADTESSINRNYRDAQQAYFAAAAGIQEARERLTPTSTTVLAPPTTLPNNGVSTGVVYIINYTGSIAASSIQPWNSGNTYFDTEFCHENFSNAGTALVTNTGPNTPCAAVPTGTYYTTVNSNSPFLGADSNLPYRWVRVTLKSNKTAVPDTTLGTSYYVNASGSANNVPICWNGTAELPKPAGYATCDVDPPPDGVTYLKSVYMLTALAITQNGSRRMTQMEVANNPPFLTNAALDTDDFVTVKGSSVTVNGYDNCKCHCIAGKGSAPPTCTDRVSGAACTGSTYAIFSSQTVSTSGGPALVAGTSPAVAQNQTFPYDVPSLIAKYSSMTGTVNTTGAPYNISCTAATPPAYPDCGKLNSGTLGTVPSPFPPTDPNNPVGGVNQITYVPGSFDIQAKTSGAGVLIIDGDLTIHGGLNFYGLIIVRGVLTFSGSGTGQDNNVIGSIISGNGSVADSLAGGINIQYDRCALLHNQIPSPPALLANHEVSY